jgi:hypothetical protein
MKPGGRGGWEEPWQHKLGLGSLSAGGGAGEGGLPGGVEWWAPCGIWSVGALWQLPVVALAEAAAGMCPRVSPGGAGWQGWLHALHGMRNHC